MHDRATYVAQWSVFSLLTMATPAALKKVADFKKEAWLKVEAALQRVCDGHFPRHNHVKRKDRSRFKEVLTVEKVEMVSQSKVPVKKVTDANHLSVEHKFDHRPSQKLESHDLVDCEVGANGDVLKV